MLTFYVPETISLDDVGVKLDILGENLMADSYSFVGTTGRIGINQVWTSLIEAEVEVVVVSCWCCCVVVVVAVAVGCCCCCCC